MALDWPAADPVFVWVARGTVAVLFLAAGLSKLRRLNRFRAAVEGYALLPKPLVPPVAIGLALGEIASAGLLLWPGTAWAAGLALWAMLLLFSVAVGVNLWRGRTDIDCGCWLFGAPEQGSALGASMLARNIAVAALVLVAVLPIGPRPLGAMDFLTAAMGSLAALGLFAIAAQLTANHRRLAGPKTQPAS